LRNGWKLATVWATGMKWNRQTSIFLFLGILFNLPLMIPLLPKTIALGWDMGAHLTRTWALHQALIDGSFPPRWSSYLAFGYGSPVLMFNWSLPYYLGSLFIQCGAPLFSAYHGVVAVTIIASFLSMYIFLLYLAPPLWAFIGAIFFSWAPYRFNVNYLRSAIGENTAVIFWPIIFLSALFLFTKAYRRGFLMGSAAFALCLISHQVLFLMILPVFLLFILLRYVQTKNHTAALLSIGTILAGLLFTSYFWIPAFFEKNSIGFSSIQLLYQSNFLTWKTLVSHPLFAAFGQEPWLLMYAIGWPQISVLLFSVTLLVRMLKQKKSHSTTLIFFFLIVSLGALFLLTSNSHIFWDRISFLRMFVYPQRFLGLATFTISIVAALTLSGLANKKTYKAIFSVAFVTVIFFNAPSIMLNRKPQPVNLQQFNTPLLNTTDMTAEFMPNTIPKDFMWNIGRYEQVPLLSVLSGQATVKHCIQTSSTISCVIETKTPASFRLRQFYFPGWSVFGDNKELPLRMDQAVGTLVFDVPANTTTITARFGNTPLRTIANSLTFLSVIVYCVFLLLFSSIKKR